MVPRYISPWRRPTNVAAHVAHSLVLQILAPSSDIWAHVGLSYVSPSLSSMLSFPLCSAAATRASATSATRSAISGAAAPASRCAFSDHRTRAPPAFPGSLPSPSAAHAPCRRRTVVGSHQATVVARLRCCASVTPSPPSPSRYTHVSLVWCYSY